MPDYLNRAFDRAAYAGALVGLDSDCGPVDLPEPDPSFLSEVAAVIQEVALLAEHAAESGDADGYVAIDLATNALTYMTSWLQCDYNGMRAARDSFLAGFRGF